MRIDYRENRSQVPQLLRQFGVPVEMADLPVDYVITSHCFVERKTAADFTASIADCRIFKQVCFLAQSCPNPLLILEGDMAHIRSRISINSVRGVTLWIMLEKKVPVLQTRNEYATARILRHLAKKYGNSSIQNMQLMKRKQKLRSLRQQQMALLTQIPGIGRQTANDILRAYGSLSNITNAADSELLTIPHVGKERLQAIRHIFPQSKS